MSLSQKWRLGEVVRVHCPACGCVWTPANGTKVQRLFNKLVGHCPKCVRQLGSEDNRAGTGLHRH